MPRVTVYRRLAAAVALLLPAAVAIVLWLTVPPFAQPQGYHHFADTRGLAGIPNAGDTLSNLAILLVGMSGLACLLHPTVRRGGRAFVHSGEALPYLVFFTGCALVGLGSAWYHLAPDNLRLFWDRLPMSLTFMAMLAGVIGDRVNPALARRTLPVLLLLGAAGAGHWIWTETSGAGDLRLYLATQAVPIASVLLLIALCPCRYTRGRDVLVAIGWYGLALVAENLDRPILALTGLLSGHTLKHLLAATAMAWVLRMLLLRRPLHTAGVGETRGVTDRQLT